MSQNRVDENVTVVVWSQGRAADLFIDSSSTPAEVAIDTGERNIIADHT